MGMAVTTTLHDWTPQKQEDTWTLELCENSDSLRFL